MSDRVADVAVGHADLVGGAEDEVVGVGELLLDVGVEDLGGAAEQPVSVDRGRPADAGVRRSPSAG